MSWRDADKQTKREVRRILLGWAAFIGLIVLGFLAMWLLAPPGFFDR